MSAQQVELTPEFFLRQRSNSGWVQQTLSQLHGYNRFETARICDDIQITRSHCELTVAYQCRIEHPRATTLILFGESGISHFGLGDSREMYTVRPGDLWLINLNDTALLRVTPPDQSCRLQVLKYNSDRITRVLDTEAGLAKLSTCAVRLARQSHQPASFQQLLQNRLASPGDRLMAEAHALELVAHNLGLLLSGTCTAGLSGAACPQVRRAVELLTQDLATPPTLDQLALQTGMSHVRLNREFKKQFGCTVFSWLRQHRLEQACFCLSHTDEPITLIAARLGYSNASHFSTCFRQVFNCTPQQYRQQLR